MGKEEKVKTLAEYEVLKISDKPIINNTYKHDYEARKMGIRDDKETWSHKVCPACEKEKMLKLFDAYCTVQWEQSNDLIWTDSVAKNPPKWLEIGNEYQCKGCNKHIYYAQRYKVHYISIYYTLTSSPFNPGGIYWKTEDIYIPEVPKWENSTCPACGEKGLKTIKGDSSASPTGKSSADAVQHCAHCGMYVQSHEYDD